MQRLALMLLVVVEVLSACSTTLTLDTVQQAEKVGTPAVLRPGDVQLSARAEGIEGRTVGREHTIFYIPTKRVRIEGDAGEEVMRTVKRALEIGGYRVSIQASSTPTTVPLLKCRIEEFWFSNYTWTFPFVPTWGAVTLTLTAESTEGVRWSRSFSSHAFAASPVDGFSAAANDAMGAILREMVEAFTTDEFYQTVATKTATITTAEKANAAPSPDQQPTSAAVASRLEQLKSRRRVEAHRLRSIRIEPD